MKICQEHWDALRQAIDDAGLTPFVSGNGDKAAAKLEAQLLQGGQDATTFDPLMNANLAIWANAVEMGGAYLMFGDENGNPYCPMCESEKHGCHPAHWWITHAVEDQINKARELGLLLAQQVN